MRGTSKVSILVSVVGGTGEDNILVSVVGGAVVKFTNFFDELNRGHNYVGYSKMTEWQCVPL